MPPTKPRRPRSAVHDDLATTLVEVAEATAEIKKLVDSVAECDVELRDYSAMRFSLLEMLVEAEDRLDALRFVLRARHGITVAVTPAGSILTTQVRPG